MSHWLNTIKNAVFPPVCLFCSDPGHNGYSLCKGCRNELIDCDHVCMTCGLLPSTANKLSAANVCAVCANNPPAWDQLVCGFDYDAAIAHLVVQQKFHGSFAALQLAADLMIERLGKETISMPEAILPAPLHKQRLQQRGYNQALELARPLAQTFKLPLLKNVIKRRKNTQAQTELSRKKRLANLRGAFQVVAPLPYSHITIVDDVMTTGATAKELTRVLKRAGVQRVDVWVFARAAK